MFSPRLFFLLLSLASCELGSIAHAQTETPTQAESQTGTEFQTETQNQTDTETETQKPKTFASESALVAYLSRQCTVGSYDVALESASNWIDAAENAAPPRAVGPKVYYWRGLAELRIGWFAHAQSDMEIALAGGVNINPDGPQAILEQIERIKAVLPGQTTEIRNGDDVAFRVYYGQKDPVTRAILDTLPLAYRINSQMYGATVVEQPVFIFNTMAQMSAFMQARGITKMASWGWAYGGRDVFYFCLQDPQGTAVSTFGAGYVRASVAHENNHSVFRRAMGNVQVPRWFVEGIAQVAGAQVSKEDVALNDYTIARLFAVSALVPPQNLEDSTAFSEHTEQGAALDRAGAGKAAPSPYAQAFHMTRFLLANMRAGQLMDFLNRVREDSDFNRAFAEEFNMTLPQFYALWYAQTRQKLKS